MVTDPHTVIYIVTARHAQERVRACTLMTSQSRGDLQTGNDLVHTMQEGASAEWAYMVTSLIGDVGPADIQLHMHT